MVCNKIGSITFLLLALFSVNVFAIEAAPKCDNQAVLQTDYWAEFKLAVQAEYYPDTHPDRVPIKHQARFYGHALGRLATAVNNDSNRQDIYDCVYLGIYQDIGILTFGLPDGIFTSGYLFNLMKDASIGGLDAQIEADSGVTSAEPLNDYFNKIVPQVKVRGTTAAVPTGNSGVIIKADPVTGFGGVGQQAAASTGTCDSWMTITMEDNMEKTCQGFVDNGYGRRPSETECIVCAPDDWHPTVVQDSMQGGVDLPGLDLTSLLLDQADPALCRTACENNGQCKAWTYVRPGEQDSKAKCWLKHGVPKSVKSDCCVSGVTKDALNDAGEALLAAKACSVADIKSGKEWRFQQNVGYGIYFEHSGYLCPESGTVAIKVEGKKLVRFSCQKGWQSCTRNKSLDGELIYPAEDYQWGPVLFSKLQVKWLGMTPRVVYIQK